MKYRSSRAAPDSNSPGGSTSRGSFWIRKPDWSALGTTVNSARTGPGFPSGYGCTSPRPGLSTPTGCRLPTTVVTSRPPVALVSFSTRTTVTRSVPGCHAFAASSVRNLRARSRAVIRCSGFSSGPETAARNNSTSAVGVSAPDGSGGLPCCPPIGSYVGPVPSTNGGPPLGTPHPAGSAIPVPASSRARSTRRRSGMAVPRQGRYRVRVGQRQVGRGQRQRGAGQPVPGPYRQGQPELRPLPRLPPRLQPATVQPGVLQADRQPEPGTAGLPGPGRVGPPEPVEHLLLVARRQPDPMVPDGHRHGMVVSRQADPHRALLAVLDGVADEVAQDPFHPPRVDLGDHRRGRHGDLQGRTAAAGEGGQPLGDPGDDLRQVARFGVQDGEPGIEPADLHQGGEQGLE